MKLSTCALLTAALLAQTGTAERERWNGAMTALSDCS
jgi:hypothetical protein